ncbi:MAG: FesM [Gemmatimonadota bacterium]
MTNASAGVRPRDLLKAPLLGPFLRWRHSRSVLQALFLGMALLVMADGFWGPRLAPKNMAGVLPWVHWRGFVALALLVAGNLFCMACPFMLPRRWAKKLLPARKHWPKALRTKWLALFLLFLFLWAYEAFDLWSSPLLTAWLALGYFVAAFVIDGFFRGAAFCKHVCPIGQFHFVNSLASPLEVAIREAGVCASCRTRDCIVGRYEKPRGLDRGVTALRPHERGKLLQNGCELWLYQETKAGNMDCTFCMECIHACPHDNVGILTRPPARELWEDPQRAGVGRFSRRPDLAAMALFLTFAAFMNAFGMVTPVYALEEWMGRAMGTTSGPVVVGVLFLFGMILLPAFLVGATAWVSATLSGSGRTITQEATRYGYALVPLGFGMWVAHYLFHFLVGGLTIIPLTQEYLAYLGFSLAGTPSWALGPMVPESWLLPLELALLELGLLVSLVVAFRIAVREVGNGPKAARAFAPWGLLALSLSVAGVWLLLQPMEMRGTLLGG